MAIHSVSEVNRFIKGLLDAEGSLQRIMIRGELSNFKTYRSGHCYFTLKDASAALKCVMFRSRAQYLRFLPQDGQQVVASGSISVYERDGVYQLYVDSLAQEGQGALSEALRQLKEPCEVRLCSDSQYVINGLEKGWAKGWRKRGWKKADKSPALNPDLWAPLLEESEKHVIHYHWLKGHAGHPENERCDRLAVEQSKKYGGKQA